MDKEKEIKHGAVQTLAEDMAKVIESDRGGLIKKIIHGEEEHEKEKNNLSPESTKNRLFMLMGFVFFLLGLATFFFFLHKGEVPTVPVEKQFVPLVFSDASTSLEVVGFKKDEIAQAVRNATTGTEVKVGGVEGVYLVHNKKSVGLREFIALIKGNFVPDKNPLLVNDNFLMGVANTGTNDFFILIKVRSLADIFDSMRAWESKMFADLQGFFGVAISADTKYLLTAPFEDVMVQNKNARVLRDKERGVVLMYVFADDNSVILTQSENAVREIMLRLAASQIKK